MPAINQSDPMQPGTQYTFWFDQGITGLLHPAVATGYDVQAALSADSRFQSVDSNIKIAGPSALAATFVWQGDSVTAGEAGSQAAALINNQTSAFTTSVSFVEADSGNTQSSTPDVKTGIWVAVGVVFVVILFAVYADVREL